MIEPTGRLAADVAPADMEGRPCLLETFTEANVAYHERCGYGVTRSTTIAEDVPIHAMTRPPRYRA